MPDLWNGELNTSTVFVGRLDPLPAPLTPQQQTERPYVIGAMEITPDPSTKFNKKAELSTFVRTGARLGEIEDTEASERQRCSFFHFLIQSRG